MKVQMNCNRIEEFLHLFRIDIKPFLLYCSELLLESVQDFHFLGSYWNIGGLRRTREECYLV